MNYAKITIINLLFTFSIIIGCSDSSDNGVNHHDPNDPAPAVHPVAADAGNLLIPGGTHPVWFSDGVYFLFTYSEQSAIPGLFRGNVNDGSTEQLWNSPRGLNQDYVPSPDGVFVAFSTPDIAGGVYLLPIGGEPVLVLPGGSSPTWAASNGSLVARDALGRLVKIDRVTNPLESSQKPVLTIAESWCQPSSADTTDDRYIYQIVSNQGDLPLVSPDYTYLAYLLSYHQGGFRLMLMDLSNPEVYFQTAANTMSREYVWTLNSRTLIATRQGSEESLSDLIKVNIASMESYSILLSDAVHPSVGKNGEYLLAVALDGDQAAGITWLNLTTGQSFLYVIPGNRAAANPLRRLALVETNDGIHLISW